MIASRDERPVDCPVVVFTDDEAVKAEAFARLTIAGWGAAAQFVASDTPIAAVTPAGYECGDLILFSYAENAEAQSRHLRALFASGIEPMQVILGGPAKSFAHRTLATCFGLEVFTVDKPNPPLGSKVELDDFAQAVSSRIFARLDALMSEEVQTASLTGSLALLARLHPNSLPDSIELATGAAMIASKLSNRLSFRRSVIRAALFRRLANLADRHEIMKGARHLWELGSIFDGIACGTSAVAARTVLPMPIQSESWCVVAAEAILQDPIGAPESIGLTLQHVGLEIRTALKGAITHAAENIRKWAHDSAS